MIKGNLARTDGVAQIILTKPTERITIRMTRLR